MRILILLITSVFFLSSCATYTQHNTASGKVEVTIYNVSKQRIKERLVNEMINKGYLVTRTDDLLLVFEHPTQDEGVIVLWGPQPDTGHNIRISFNLIQISRSVRVVADTAYIANAGTGSERRVDMNTRSETIKIQAWLDDIKKSLEKK